MNISQSSIELMQHALGINERNREPYRNYFLSSGKNEEWDNLVKSGLAVSNKAPQGVCGDIYYQVTEQGKNVAIVKLPKPKAEKKNSNYEKYLDADTCLSFGEYILGNELPEYRYMHHRGKSMCMMRAYKWDKYSIRHEVEGKWMPTMKAAKASYKEALKLFRSKHG
ncbi:MAG: hypothetical protein ACQEWL_04800 [Pseudomonadota bacterium]